ncbi:hypothetical protein B0T16DRAFT_416929 [Cercophora newfieldiana]|uniref:AAA+ ATPase domain-containing protein n=1 Tax=Cercophora newfieldiana TaxID=92897 RepID=A0AA40CMH2_9PEZI|nr:hypothetical protein B0T16DRAFT_416929 [Cercophora newfieldiana]
MSPWHQVLTRKLDGQALLQSDLSQENSVEHGIRTLTLGILFFGTPHSGTSYASLATHLLRLGSPLTNISLVRHLHNDSEWLRMQRNQFEPRSEDLKLFYFYETYKTKILHVKGIMVVPISSATSSSCRNYGLGKDHKGLVRFSSSSDPDYLVVLECLKSMIQPLRAKIQENLSRKSTHHSQAVSFSSSLTSSVTATTNPSKPVMGLPFSLPIQRSLGFIGRDAQLKEIHDYLFGHDEQGALSGEQSRLAVLYGLPGAGKTQLIAAYAYAHQKKFDAVLWVDGTDQINTFLSFQEIAYRFLDNLSSREIEQRPSFSRLQSIIAKISSAVSTRSAMDKEMLPKISQAVIDLLQSSTETFTWLLILDNVDSLTDYPLSMFLPQSERGKIVITTRLTAVMRFGHPIEVGQIDKDTAVRILLNNASLRVKTESDLQDAHYLADALGALPLALENAGAWINKAQITLRRFQELLEENLNMLASSDKDQRAILTVLELSLTRLEQEDQTASKLMTLLAFLHKSAFWEGLISDLDGDRLGDHEEVSWLAELSRSRVELVKALGTIFSLSLAKRSGKDHYQACRNGKENGKATYEHGENHGGTVEIHPLVHSWARQRLDPETMKRKLLEAVLFIGKAVEKSGKSAATERDTARGFPRILPHADHVVTLFQALGAKDTSIFPFILHDVSAATALFNIAAHLQDNTRLQPAEQVFRAIIAHSVTPLMTATAQRQLGQILTLFSNYDEAESLLSTSVTSLTTLLGPSNTETLSSKFCLGVVHHRCFRYAEASVLLREVIKFDTHPATNQTGALGREAASILALVCRHLGRDKEGLELVDTMLAQTDASDLNTAHVLTLQYRRALLLRQSGRWDEALSSYLSILSGMRTTLGPWHPLTLRAANALGHLYLLLGRYSDSREMLLLASSGQSKLGFSQETETAQLRTIFNLGVLSREEERYHEAAELLARSLESEVRLHGPEAYSTLRCRLEMAVLKIRSSTPGVDGDELEKGLRELQSVLEVQVRKCPDAEGEQAWTRIMLSEGLVKAERWEQAMDVLAPAVKWANESSFPSDNPVWLRIELVRTKCLLALGREGEMGMGVRELVEMLERVYGEHWLTREARVVMGKSGLGVGA